MLYYNIIYTFLKHFVESRYTISKTPYFDDKKIVFIFYPPHLLKATRNNFFEYHIFQSQEIK